MDPFKNLDFMKNLPKPIIIKILENINICDYIFTSLYPYLRNTFDELFLWKCNSRYILYFILEFN
jgi:hypothetical protein